MTLAPMAPRKKRRSKALWFERVMAMLALTNYILVLFDLSYIPFRALYLKYFPEMTVWYGETFKGIEPHRFTESYLEAVDALDDLVAETSLNSPAVAVQLKEVQDLSTTMINENPFQASGQTAALERIKAEMRDRIGLESASESFAEFWSVDYLRRAGWTDSIQFFQQEIAPLLDSNYFRTVDITGRPVDRFWVIDQPFVIIFAVEYLLRTFYLSRRYKGSRWIETMIWRWYDILLLIPFWRWLRCIPVSIRLTQADIFNVLALVRRLKRDLITNFAQELTEIVVLQVIDQTQALLEEGVVSQWLLSPNRRYVDINGIDEVGLISKRLSTVLVEQVLPAIKPELDAVLNHSVSNALKGMPVYGGLVQLPGAQDLSDRLTQRIVADVSQNVYGALQSALKDEQGAELTQALVRSFGDHLRTEIREGDTVDELQYLLVALLDEVKVNYARRVEAEDIADLEEKTQRIYSLTRQVEPAPIKPHQN